MIDLTAPFEADRLLEIRTSAMKQMPGLTIMSGIDKKLCNRPMKIDEVGLEGDEHDLTFHGGPDKAVLGYCSSHYPNWQESYPEAADKFVPGGFGENFVTAHMNERNVCIGDIISVGSEVMLQVSLPRSPCFKLNHRFSLKKFAPVTYETSRTGWYYRVIRGGMVQVGDDLRLVERKWPKWTIERIQEYLHRNTDNFEMNQELSRIEELGMEARGQFQNRVAKALKKKDAKTETWTDYRIIERHMETPRVVSLTFEAVDPSVSVEEKEFGLHSKLRLPNTLTRSYSVVSGEGKALGRRFELGVALEKNSRGGSKYLHENAHVGDVVPVGKFTTSVAPDASASMHVFIAGGIGITAFIALMKRCFQINWDFKLHYAVQSVEDMPYRERLAPYGSKVVVYDKSKGQRMDINEIVRGMPWNSHLYVCGPDRMMDAAKNAVAESGLSPNEVHYEAFGANISGDPFEAEVANRDGKVVKVGEEESLLEVLRREFDDVPSSCEVGNCGTCKVSLMSGRVDHRGTALLEEDKASSMLSCVSRGIGRIAIEI
ncbi:pyruvate kinase-like protein [Emericellopsis atlantica]|uniref:Pyruvate kinase-like protein n=1 Tax=Emericellopsis atlantica TaxID=2614577 RepID=A0A9P7ZID2_9HYPO|nr:pyruvate kinase-like protein [Emericellopsis atlantica]KAG9252033.1 pyruvate kinase-like protein [Emericellopsis atlantica]